MYLCLPLIWIVLSLRFKFQDYLSIISILSTCILFKKRSFNFFKRTQSATGKLGKLRQRCRPEPLPAKPNFLSFFLENLDLALVSMYFLFLINYKPIVSNLAKDDRYTDQQTCICNTCNFLKIKPLSINQMC